MLEQLAEVEPDNSCNDSHKIDPFKFEDSDSEKYIKVIQRPLRDEVKINPLRSRDSQPTIPDFKEQSVPTTPSKGEPTIDNVDYIPDEGSPTAEQQSDSTERSPSPSTSDQNEGEINKLYTK